MLESLAMPNTGMAVAIDIGEANDIHPKNKQESATAWPSGPWPRCTAEPVATSGPLPAGHEIRGHDAIVRFKHTDGGLVAKNGDLRVRRQAADGQWVSKRQPRSRATP